MLTLYVQAPFAAFRTFTAGWYRPTAGFLTPSAAYGLALNLAGIETRRDDGLSAMTVTAFDLPPVRIALGADPENPRGPFPSVQTLYQQLHNYPVGASGKERKDDAKGNKYNITPVRREFLADLRAFVCLDGEPRPGEPDQGRTRRRTSASHAMDSRSSATTPSFLTGSRSATGPVKAHWYRRLGPDDEAGVVPHTTRLTFWIDRQDMSETQSALYAPLTEAALKTIPEVGLDRYPAAQSTHSSHRNRGRKAESCSSRPTSPCLRIISLHALATATASST